jgi:hypothetical protein
MDEPTNDEPVLQEQMRSHWERAADDDATVLGGAEATGDALAQQLRAWPVVGRRWNWRVAPACAHAPESVWRVISSLSTRRPTCWPANGASASVRCQPADLFAWKAETQLDLAFAAPCALAVTCASSMSRRVPRRAYLPARIPT